MTRLKLFILFAFITITIQSQSLSLLNQTNQYDFVIITVDEFVPICEQFAEHKSNSKGIKTLVTTKNLILGEFGDSSSLQENIREFISYAGTNWAEPRPKYFMFAGDISSLPNYSFESFPNTEYYDIAKSDYPYGINVFAEDTTKLSFAIGRISARTETELSNYFNKVINYENDELVYDWNNNSLFLADDGKIGIEDTLLGNKIFEKVAKSVSEGTQSYINHKYFFQSDSSDYYGTTDSVINYVNEIGVSSIYFCGHGNDSIYTHEALFSISDVNRLENKNKPFFASFGHTQSFSDTNTSSMLEQMLVSTDGALVGFASVVTVYLYFNEYINRAVWSKLYTQKNLGDILLDVLKDNSSLENRKYNLFGDPTIVLKYNPIADIAPNPENLPKEFSLAQNYPNPFNPSTKITYSIPDNLIGEQNVKLSIFNILGQEVATIVNTVQRAGNYEVVFDASHLSSGTYLYQLKSGSFVKTSKMLLLK